MVDRVTERTDGVTAERVTEHDSGGGTVIVERRSGGGVGILIAVVLFIAVAVGALYLFNQGQNDAIRTDAVSDAAKGVEGAADKIGAAADKAGDAVSGGGEKKKE